LCILYCMGVGASSDKVKLCDNIEQIITLEWRDASVVGVLLSGEEVLCIQGLTEHDLYSSLRDKASQSISTRKLTFFSEGQIVDDYSKRIDKLDQVMLKAVSDEEVTIEELLIRNMPVDEIKALGVDVKDLKKAGATIGQLRTLGFSLLDIRAGGFSVADFKASNYIQVAQLRQAGFTLTNLYNEYYDIKDFRAAGICARELRDEGWNIGDVRGGGYTLDECIAGGYDPRDPWGCRGINRTGI